MIGVQSFQSVLPEALLPAHDGRSRGLELSLDSPARHPNESSSTLLSGLAAESKYPRIGVLGSRNQVRNNGARDGCKRNSVAAISQSELLALGSFYAVRYTGRPSLDSAKVPVQALANFQERWGNILRIFFPRVLVLRASNSSRFAASTKSTSSPPATILPSTVERLSLIHI